MARNIIQRVSREDQITYFARTNSRYGQRLFGIRRRDRRKHMYVVGKRGTGKTTLLGVLIRQDIDNAQGLAFLDPHGDLVEQIFLEVPDRRRDDVIYFNVPLELAAQKAGWGKRLPQGRGRGIAVHESFGSFIAHVAEVSVSKEGKVRVHRVVCAIDCGPTVNPDSIRAQMEGAIVFGLTAALYGEITFEKGRVKQRNFHDYPMLRMNEMPAVEVYIVPSTDKMGGVGEPGVPPVAPAVCNAIFALTGKRIRRLPIRPEDLRAV